MLHLRKNIKLVFIILLFTLFTVNVNAATDGCWVHLVDIANPLTLDEIKSRYTVYDQVDGDITNKLIFETSYDENNLKLGEYKITVSVTNSRKKTNSQTDLILVRDFVKPTLKTLTNQITIDIGQTSFLEGLSNYLILEDNLETLDYNSLKINNFDLDNVSPGFYQISVYCVDSSTNKSNTIDLDVTIIDSTNKTNYTLTTSKKLTIDEVINILKENNIIPKEYKTIQLESSFFNDDANYGKHKAYLKIETLENEIISYTFNINYLTKNTQLNPFPILTILGAILLIQIIIYIKRN